MQKHSCGSMSRLVFILLVLSVVLCLAECYRLKAHKRRDVHRIILKPQRSKRHKQKFRGEYDAGHAYHSNYNFEPHAYSSSNYENYQPHHKYKNHHEEYHDLIQPRPPRPHKPYLNYPEEEQHYDFQESFNQHYIQYPPNNFAPWSPVSTFNNEPSPTLQTTTTTIKRKKKPKRKAIQQTTTASPFLDFPQLSTIKPHKQSTHFASFHNNNQSLFNYEVNNKPSKLKKKQKNYQVYEQINDNKALAYTQVHYPTPTQRTFLDSAKNVNANIKTLDYGKRTKKIRA